MQKITASFILATAMFITLAIPKESSENKAVGMHQAPVEQKENLVFGDGAHKNWKQFAESNPNFQFSESFR